ncbi:MAG: M14 family zinc carboxypeptidase [Chitinophagaceae bacterium]
MRNQLVFFAIFILLSVTALSQETVSKVKIFVTEDKAKFSELIGLLQIDHFMPEEDGSIISELSSEELQKLKTSSYHFEILIPDVVKYLDSVNQVYYKSLKDPASRVALEQPNGVLDQIIVRPAAFEVKSTFGGYYSFAEMEAAMNTLVASYPAIASKTSIGKTHGNRDIWLIKISDNVVVEENTEPAILYMGLQHAREAITGASMIFFMQYLCERYYSDSRIKDLVDNREIYIIPCFNPDGWEYNRTSEGGNAGGMWRKNRRLNPSGYYGVDLNRNWGVDWANCSSPILGSASSCGSGSTSSDTYWGPSAFSEPETQAVRDFAKNKKLIIGFDQHAFGPYYSLPFGRKSLHPNDMTVKGAQFYEAIPAIMGKYNGMRAADSYDALGYEVAGGFKDWMYMGELGSGAKDTVYAMTGEGGAGGGTTSNFWAPASQIVNLSKGMCYQNLQLAFSAGTYVDVEDVSDLALSSITGNFNFRIKRLGLGNDQLTVSVVPIQNIASVGVPVTINSMNYYEEITQNISYSLVSGLTSGQVVKFAWKIETGGYTYFDTIVKILNPIELLYDNMEGTFSNNWSVPNGSGEKWSFTDLAAYSGTKSMTESPSGDYTGGSTRTVTYNNTLNLGNATASYLTFWVKHRAENFRDKLRVEVSPNGTNWYALTGKTTVREPGTLDGSTINGNPALTGIQDYWTKEVFDLSAYNGQTALQLRFVFTSDNTSSSFKYKEDDGFYIDELKVYKTSSTLVVLPAQFHDFNGKLISNNTVQLWWEATTDANHNYFEVERSANGNSFSPIGKRFKGEAYNYTDISPVPGNNFYRIKQVDNNGKIIYSKTINIAIQNKFTVNVYPNPVDDLLHIKLSAVSQQGSTLKITDLYGRQLYMIRIMTASENEIIINVSRWKPQVYLLSIYNNNGEMITIQKIIKN